MKCSNCGKKYNGFFCPDCKEKSFIKEEIFQEEPEFEELRKSEKLKNKAYIFFIIAIAGGIVSLALMFGNVEGAEILLAMSFIIAEIGLICIFFYFLSDMRLLLEEIKNNTKK